jgi:hypothetical protein
MGGAWIRRSGVAFLLLAAQVIASSGREGDRRAFPLTEISGFGTGSGQTCVCGDKPEPNVAYPTFASAKPLYGTVRVNADWDSEFSGTVYRFAVDESGATGKGYDRLYVDLDRDGSLVDDSPILPLKDPPSGIVIREPGFVQQVCFGQVSLDGTGENIGQSVLTIPRLAITKDQYATVSFIPPQARQGTIEIADVPFNVTMYNGPRIATRWNKPQTGLQLRPQGRSTVGPVQWSRVYLLSAMPYFGEQYWRLSTTPGGDRLFVEPYRGDFGTLTVGSGNRLRGQLLGKEMAVYVGQEFKDGRFEPVRSCRVPVGDYAPEMLAVSYGLLDVEVSFNYHSDGKARQRDKPIVYPLKIRKDKPCVFDFGDKAQVLFTSPARDSRIGAGDTLTVKAVLVDPKLDIMIRGLREAPHEEIPRRIWITLALITVGPFAIWAASGTNRRRHRVLLVLSALGLVGLAGCIIGLRTFNASLLPKNNPYAAYQDLHPWVTITRAGGEVVASGSMPFG